MVVVPLPLHFYFSTWSKTLCTIRLAETAQMTKQSIVAAYKDCITEIGDAADQSIQQVRGLQKMPAGLG
jgi:hypothetical protein